MRRPKPAHKKRKLRFVAQQTLRKRNTHTHLRGICIFIKFCIVSVIRNRENYSTTKKSIRTPKDTINPFCEIFSLLSIVIISYLLCLVNRIKSKSARTEVHAPKNAPLECYHTNSAPNNEIRKERKHFLLNLSCSKRREIF